MESYSFRMQTTESPDRFIKVTGEKQKTLEFMDLISRKLIVIEDTTPGINHPGIRYVPGDSREA